MLTTSGSFIKAKVTFEAVYLSNLLEEVIRVQALSQNDQYSEGDTRFDTKLPVQQHFELFIIQNRRNSAQEKLSMIDVESLSRTPLQGCKF